MTTEEQSKAQASPVASTVLSAIKLDFNTIRTIVLTVCVVMVLISIPLAFMLRNFVTFDALDSYLKVTESVRPKILRSISEELGAGYSKNFLFDSATVDNSMTFFAAKSERVTLSVDEVPVEGGFQTVALQLNGCPIGTEKTDVLHMFNRDLTTELTECPPDEPDLHTLKIVLPNGLKKNTTFQIKCLVVVYQRLYDRQGVSK